MLTRTTRAAALGSVLGAVATRYLLDTTVARDLSLELFADYALLMTLGILIGSVAPLGLAEVGNRLVPELIQRGDGASLHAYLRLVPLIGVAVGAALAGMVILVAEQISDRPQVLVLSLLLAAPSIALLNLRRAQSLQLNGGDLVLFSPAISTGLSIVMIIGVALLRDGPLSLLWVAGCIAGGNVIVALGVCRVRHPLPRTAGRLPGREELLSWVRSGGHAVSNAVGTILLTQGDIILVGMFASGAEAGAYAAASRLALVVTLALGGLAPREAPILGRYIGSGDMRGAWQHYRQARRLTSLAGFVLCASLIMGGAMVLELFVPGSGTAATWLAVLAVGRLASAVVGPAAELLIALGAQRFAARSSWLGVAVGAGAVCLLGSILGPMGVALGTSLGMVTRSVLHYIFARHHCHPAHVRESMP